MTNLVKQVSIIIGTHNQPKAFAECLNSIFCWTRSLYQMILVLNDADPKTKRIAKKFASWHPDTIIINNKDNRGFASWNNQAVKFANRRFVLFLNDDTYVSFNWLESMVKLFLLTNNHGAVSKKLLRGDLPPQETPSGTCLLVERKNAHFNPAFKGYYFEDLELINRLKKKGLKVVVEKEYPITHKGRLTADTVGDINEKTAYNERVFSALTKAK